MSARAPARRKGSRGLAALASLAVALTSASWCLAATPAGDAAFAKTLSASIGPTFKKEAPGLALGRVTCALPARRGVVACIARFRDAAAGATVVYGIKVSGVKAGRPRATLSWTTTTHYCVSLTTHKRLAC